MVRKEDKADEENIDCKGNINFLIDLTQQDGRQIGKHVTSKFVDSRPRQSFKYGDFCKPQMLFVGENNAEPCATTA